MKQIRKKNNNNVVYVWIENVLLLLYVLIKNGDDDGQQCLVYTNNHVREWFVWFGNGITKWQLYNNHSFVDFCRICECNISVSVLRSLYFSCIYLRVIYYLDPVMILWRHFQTKTLFPMWSCSIILTNSIINHYKCRWKDDFHNKLNRNELN